MAANLTYALLEGTLTGTAGGRMFHIRALSGGGRIPAGRYRIDPPRHTAHLGLSCFLAPYGLDGPDPHATVLGRHGFYIHGRAPHGSDDGCIVPVESFQELIAGLARDRGGELFVLEAMGGSRFM
jgi:hypothetical protein